MKKFLLTLLGVLIALPALARDFTYEYEGQTLTYTVIDEFARTCKTKEGYIYESDFDYNRYYYPGNKVSGKLTIPQIVKDGGTEYSVTEIGYMAFYGCDGLTQVTIPNSVESIGSSAFQHCSKLTSVIIPNSVTSIGSSAFYGCTGLTSVLIPNSVTSIGVRAFQHCSKLTSVIIPNSVKSIGDYAFHDCTRLTQVEFASIEALCAIEFGNKYANPLYYARYLYIGGKKETEIVIPESVAAIGKYAFYGCAGLTKVTIPNSVTSIGESAFEGCTGLTEITVVASSPASIQANSFAGLYDTATLTIPEGSFDAYISSNWGQFKKIRYPDSSGICDYKTFDDGVLTYRLNTISKTAVVTGANTSAITIPERFTDDSDPDNPVRYYVTGIDTMETTKFFSYNLSD